MLIKASGPESAGRLRLLCDQRHLTKLNMLHCDPAAQGIAEAVQKLSSQRSDSHILHLRLLSHVFVSLLYTLYTMSNSISSVLQNYSNPTGLTNEVPSPLFFGKLSECSHPGSA